MEDKNKTNHNTVSEVLYEIYEQPARDMLKISPTMQYLFKMDQDQVDTWNKFIDNMTREELLKYLRHLPPVE